MTATNGMTKRHPFENQYRKQVGFPSPPQVSCPAYSVHFANRGHVTNLPCPEGEEFSLIIPNASTQGPPTSRAVQVNPTKFSFGYFTENFPINRVRSATASGSELDVMFTIEHAVKS
jgi:hypothetical protein